MDGSGGFSFVWVFWSCVCLCVWFGGRWVAPDGMSGACEVSAHALRRAVRMLVVRVLWCTSF